MKSSIKIGFVDNGRGIEPVLKVVLDEEQDADTRDDLLKTFFQDLGGASQWLRVDFHSGSGSDMGVRKYLTIYPVRPSELHKESGFMSQQSQLVVSTQQPEEGK